MELQNASSSEISICCGCTDVICLRSGIFGKAHEFWEEIWKETTSLAKKEVQSCHKMSASILKRHMNHIDASQKLWNQSFPILLHSQDPFLLFWLKKVQKNFMKMDIGNVWKFPKLKSIRRFLHD